MIQSVCNKIWLTFYSCWLKKQSGTLSGADFGVEVLKSVLFACEADFWIAS